MPAARRCFAVPPVDSNCTLNSRKTRAKSARPVLSETLKRAHRMGTKSTFMADYFSQRSDIYYTKAHLMEREFGRLQRFRIGGGNHLKTLHLGLIEVPL